MFVVFARYKLYNKRKRKNNKKKYLLNKLKCIFIQLPVQKLRSEIKGNKNRNIWEKNYTTKTTYTHIHTYTKTRQKFGIEENSISI